MEDEIAPETVNEELLEPHDLVNIDKETYKRMQMKYQKCKASYIKLKGRPLTDPDEFKRYMKCYIVKNYDKVMNGDGEEASTSQSRCFTPEYTLNETTGILDIVGVKPQTEESEYMFDMQPQSPHDEHAMVVDMQPQTGGDFVMFDEGSQPRTFEVIGEQFQTGTFDMGNDLNTGLMDFMDEVPQTFDMQPQTFDVQPQTFDMQPQTFDMQPQTFEGQPQTGALELFGDQAITGDYEMAGEQPQNGLYQILDDQLQIGAYEIVGEQAQPGAFEIVDEQPQMEKFNMVDMQPQSGQLEIIGINPQSKHTLEITDASGKTITYVDLPLLDAGECVPYDNGDEQEFFAIDDALIQPENLLIKNVEIVHYPSTYLITYNPASDRMQLEPPPAKKWRPN